MSWGEVKYAINSTLGTEEFTSLDQVLINTFGGHELFTNDDTFTVPAGISEIYISACAAGGSGATGSSSRGGASGKAGEFIIRERVKTFPGEQFVFTIGDGNTVISGKNGYSKTLAANSVIGCAPNDVLGYVTGYDAIRGYTIARSSGEINTTYAARFGGAGNGGAFGFGGAGGNYQPSDSYASYSSLGGAYINLDQNKYKELGGGRVASLVNGGDSAYPSSTYTDTAGANAGGYGAGGGGGGGGDTGKSGGKGSPGMVFIEWGGLRR